MWLTTLWTSDWAISMPFQLAHSNRADNRLKNPKKISFTWRYCWYYQHTSWNIRSYFTATNLFPEDIFSIRNVHWLHLPTMYFIFNDQNRSTFSFLLRPLEPITRHISSKPSIIRNKTMFIKSDNHANIKSKIYIYCVYIFFNRFTFLI